MHRHHHRYYFVNLRCDIFQRRLADEEAIDDFFFFTFPVPSLCGYSFEIGGELQPMRY